MSLDPVVSQLRDLYEAYPYPERMAEGASDPYLELMASFSSHPPTSPPSFLDAGCGTGLNLLGAATIYPHYQVFGCDINRVALAQIKADIKKFALKNVSILEAELSELPQSFGPPQGFNAIFCTGVLHHLTKPELALNKLADRLAPQGVLRLLVYSKRGRQNLYRFTKAVKLLIEARKPRSLKEKLAEARSLMRQLELQAAGSTKIPPPLRGHWSDANSVSDIEFADRYLNPNDIPYTPEALRKLIEGANLKVHSWFEPKDWDLKTLLSLDQIDYPPQHKLSFWQEVEIIDNLFERPLFDLYLVGEGFEKASKTIKPSSFLATNPQLFIEQVTLRGKPLAQACRLRRGTIEPLSRLQGRILSSLAERTLSLEELSKHLQEAESTSLLEEVQGLVDRDFLFIHQGVKSHA